MSDEQTAAALRFDRVPTDSTGAPASGKVAVACTGCKTPITSEYFQINGRAVCSRCRGLVESFATTPTDALTLTRAGVFGLGAGIAGAAIYYAVIAVAHLEIGIVAILIGYMVGGAVRKGARGRGGLRFQLMAVALTYASVAMAYAPLVVQAIAKHEPTEVASASTTGGSAAVAISDNAPVVKRVTPGRAVVGLIALAGFIVALPVLVVVGSLPSGLISALIIFFGMKQAWRMTRAVAVDIAGPYRVGTMPVPNPA